MRRTKAQSPAFVQPKGLQVSNKDAVMEKVNDIVTVELVEKKVEEVEKKVEETTDKVLDTVQETSQQVADKIEDSVEKIAKPLTDVIDKLDDDPRVKVVLDSVTDAVSEQLDGREISCGCFGWMFALRITRKVRASSQTTPAVSGSKLPELPPQHEEAKETPQATAPAEPQAESSSKETCASA